MGNRPRIGVFMTPQRYQEIRAVFEAVVSLPPGERVSTLRGFWDRDPELAGEVEALIATHERRGSFIGTPAVRLPEEPPAFNGRPAAPSIDSYQLLEIVGEGGMGQVWRAEQLVPVRRIVAVKLIKAGMDTQEVVRRFESERQALAVMNHPAIARVFDAGSTSEGRPYFAMEFVAGIPLTTYCEQHQLTTNDRLKLFIRVCEGIQHAHHKAIIHRDIKPSNILVIELDGKPLPKIIDFGVARAISPDPNDDVAVTRLGAILGTPEYMSPEQARASNREIDTRTDVYSLGVVLYELLAGRLPYDLRGLPFHEALGKIAKDPAPRPSSGDLGAIALKALEKDPAQRYGSPSEMAADLARYLRNEPVLARPANVLYFTRKFLRRHSLSVAGAFGVLAALMAFGVSQNVQLHRITRERDRADRIAQFMTDMFRVSDPSESRGNQVKAREILDRASGNIEKGLANDPEMQAKLMNVMGQVYYRLGLYERAETLLTHSLESRTRILGHNHLETAQAMNDLANALAARGRQAEARKLDREVLAIRERILGRDHPDTLKAMNNLAVDMVDEGQYREAEQLEWTVFHTRERVLGAEDPNTLMAMENLGGTLTHEGRLREAEDLERRAVAIRRRTDGSDHPETIRAIQHLSETLYDEGRYPEAETLAREVLSTRQKVLGPEHPETVQSLLAVANPLENEGRLADAERLVRDVIRREERILGPEHPSVLLAMNNLAGILAEEGRYKEAESLARRVVELRSRVLGPEHAYTLHSYAILAWVLLLQGSLDDAEQIARRTHQDQLRRSGLEDPETAFTTYILAGIEAHRGNTDHAESLLRESVDHGLKPNAALGISTDPVFRVLHGKSGFQAVAAYAAEQARSQNRSH